MKRADLLKRISKQAKANHADWSLLREGADHSIYQANGQRISIPRHREINEITAASILKTASDAMKET